MEKKANTSDVHSISPPILGGILEKGGEISVERCEPILISSITGE